MAYSILIAEDDPSIAELINMTLSASGYSCRIASDGSTAIQCNDAADYSLVLLDIMLPGIDGYKLLEGAGDETCMTKINPKTKGSIKIPEMKSGN